MLNGDHGLFIFWDSLGLTLSYIFDWLNGMRQSPIGKVSFMALPSEHFFMIRLSYHNPFITSEQNCLSQLITFSKTKTSPNANKNKWGGGEDYWFIGKHKDQAITMLILIMCN